MTYAAILVITVLAPLVAALLGLVGPRRRPEIWSFPASAISLAGAILLLVQMRTVGPVRIDLLALVPGLNLALRADGLGLTFALLASGLWVVAAWYSSGYAVADQMHHRTRYHTSFAASIGAALGVALAENLLTFFLFYELLTLTTYPLVAHKQTPRALAAGRRYLAFALGGGALLLVAIVWSWKAAGTLDFRPGGFLAGHIAPSAVGVLFLLFMIGCGVKSAIMPLHSWLPAAMVAPSPVSALLHAVAVVKAGVFGCMRVVGFVFGPELLAGNWATHTVVAACVVTIIVGSLMAVQQDNLKRRLAYSTVVHLSTIVLGAALLAPLALVGAMVHMVNHGLAKITLFFCAGAIHTRTHIENISDMRGLARRMPWTMAAFTVASLGLIGLPGLCGFVGKFLLARGAWEAGAWLPLGVVVGMSILSAAYLLPIIRTAVFDEPGEDLPSPICNLQLEEGKSPGADLQLEGDEPSIANRKSQIANSSDAPPMLVVPLLVTAGLVVVFGAVPLVLAVQYGLAQSVARQVFGGAP